ncbi:MAG: hypothetical protein CVU91_06895 [Firmicutes bacterium HGW-Firmicutes-16]|nr:MAG: hypothetical protein CVU91_06895 [Firmicutes bacterium HGW-Firmicutes-16]
MKSLNRTLSLVLVLAMCLGLMGIATAATFTDSASVQYTEAVDVMTGLGVINGMDTGSFNPQGNLTREQAAKLVCYLSMGKTAADALRASSAPFTDVAADRWSAGSIAYCVQQGIVAGNGDGTFAPTANVTGYQFAKMLLVALGYDASIEQFTGPSWSINVAKYAFANKLFTGNDAFNGNAAATREEAALYTLNLIQAKTVSYASKGTSIVVNGTTITTGASAAAQGAVFMATYYPNLTVATGVDTLGRPALVWTNKGVEIGSYAKTAAFTSTADMNYTAGISSLTASLKNYSFATLDRSNVVENGKPEGAVGALSAINSVSALAAKTGNGTLVQVFTDPTIATKVTAISITKTDIAKVAAVNAATKTVTLTTTSNAPVQASYTITDLASSKLYAAVKDLAVDTLVIVTPTWNGVTYSVAAVSMPTTVSGYITTVNTSTGTIYLDGKSYDMGAAQTAAVGTAAPSGSLQATLVLDSYGYVVHSKTATVAAKNFMYVLDCYNTITDGKIVAMVKGVLTDGTIVDVVASGAGSSTTGLKTIGVVANDVYPLTNAVAIAAPVGTAIAAANSTIALKTAGVINAYDKAMSSATQASAVNYNNNYFSANVKVVYINTTTKTATVKTGIQAVASIPVGSVAVTEVNSATDATSVVSAIYLVDGVAATIDSTSLLYVPSATATGTTILKNSSTGKYETFNIYKAYLNGVAVEGGIATNSTVAANSFYGYGKSDTTGAYVLSGYAQATGTSAIVADTAITSTFSNTLIKVGGTDIDITGATIADTRTAAQQAATPVVMNAAGICSAADTDTVNVSIVYNTTTGKAATVYITSIV